MKKIQDIAGFLFIVAVAVLAVVSIFGVWDFFDKDVITKSFETLGLLAVVSVIVIVAGKFVGHSTQMGVVEVPHPGFKSVRKSTLGVLIVAAVLLAFTGVMAIWDLAEKEVLYRSLGSLAVLVFASLIIVITCLEREGAPTFKNKNAGLPIVFIVILVFLGYIVLSFFSHGF